MNKINKNCGRGFNSFPACMYFFTISKKGTITISRRTLPQAPSNQWFNRLVKISFLVTNISNQFVERTTSETTASKCHCSRIEQDCGKGREKSEKLNKRMRACEQHFLMSREICNRIHKIDF